MDLCFWDAQVSSEKLSSNTSRACGASARVDRGFEFVAKILIRAFARAADRVC